MVAHSPEIRAIHDKTYGKYRSILESMLGQLSESEEAPPFKLRQAAPVGAASGAQAKVTLYIAK